MSSFTVVSEGEWLEAKDFARKLRKSPTPAEVALWALLRKSELKEFRFVRQIGIASYIADFCSRSFKVVVELDGGSHDGHFEEDAARDAAMESLGYLVLHFANDEVLERPGSVAPKIVTACEGRPRFRY